MSWRLFESEAGAPVACAPGGARFPMAPKRLGLDGPPLAVFLDMDGTLTNTEPLCIQAMDTVFREAWPEWPGMLPERDYRHIIGFSTQHSMDYLFRLHEVAVPRYGLRRAAVAIAADWMRGPGLREGALGLATRLASIGAEGLAQCENFLRYLDGGGDAAAEAAAQALPDAVEDAHDSCVAAGYCLYAIAYETLLWRAVSPERGEAGAPALRALPGVDVLLALLSGIPGREAGCLAERLDACPGAGTAGTLSALGALLAASPPRVALVTSSTLPEARAILGSVFKQLQRGVEEWPLDPSRRAALHARLAGPEAYFDAMATASEVDETTLKPHPALYLRAIQALGLDRVTHDAQSADAGTSVQASVPARRDSRDRVLAFEDTQAGIIALRAAGIGLACAVPLPEARGQDLSAAAHVLEDGLPEAIVRHRLFLQLPA